MSKFGLFVGVYSIIMTVLFITFCFLMATINPPQIKQDPEHSRRYGTDDFIYSNEVLTNDNVVYGLEKVNDDYDSIDIISKRLNKYGKSLPTIYIDKTFKTNCTRKDVLKMVTRSMKHIKGLRRSINIDRQPDTIPRSVLLKIKDLDGQPKIEIKVVPDKSRSKKIRKYRSSSNTTNNALKFNTSKDIIVIIEDNDKLVFDFERDSIHVYDENTSAVNDVTTNGRDDTELLNNIVTEPTTKIYNLDLINTTIENVSKEVIKKCESKQINEKTMMINSEIDVESVTITSNMYIDTKTKIDFINNATKDPNTTESYVQSSDGRTDETNPGVSISNTLVGLLIPEATATLPLNYHFIN